MSVTLDDVRLARKRAYDRVDYWLQKYRGMTIHEAGISIPRIPKDLHPSEYGEWYDYFESFTGAQEEGGTQDYLEGENEPPTLDPDYHPEPEPIEPDFPEEPETPEPAEDDLTSDDVSKRIDDILNGDDKKRNNTAPDYVDYEAAIIDNAYGISGDAGRAIEEALQNIRSQFENIDDLKGYYSALEDVFKDSYLWGNLQRALKYKKYQSPVSNSISQGAGLAEVQNGLFRNVNEYNYALDEVLGGRFKNIDEASAYFKKHPFIGDKSSEEINHALQKLYRHFGMTYYREY